METSHRHKDPAVQREFERLRNKSNVASTTAVAQVQGSGGASKPSGSTQQQTPLRVKYNTTTTVVPNTTVLDFIDTATITWSITRVGTTGEIRANADGILPDGSLDQTLRNTGDFPKDWVPSSRLLVSLDAPSNGTSTVYETGTVNIDGNPDDTVTTVSITNNNTSTVTYQESDLLRSAGTGLYVKSQCNGDPSSTEDNPFGIYPSTVAVSTNGAYANGINSVTGGVWSKAIFGQVYNTSSTAITGVCYGTNSTGVYGQAGGGTASYGVFAVGSVDSSALKAISGSATAPVVVIDGTNADYGLLVSGLTYGIHCDGHIEIGGTVNRLKINNIQILTTQQAAVADATGTLASVTAQLNDLLAKLRTHGLIAT